jgi:hypothetical protein
VLFSDRFFDIEQLTYTLEIQYWSIEERRKELPIALNHPINFRHFLYLDYLKENKFWESVLIIDCRDVIFQAYPRLFGSLDKLNVAVEAVTFSDCEINQEWIIQVFGKPYLKQIMGESIICAGSTWGGTPIIRAYLDFMTNMLLEHGRTLDFGPRNTILDQAIHNDFCLSNSHLIAKHTNESGCIFTMGHTKYIQFDTKGEFINKLSDRYAIIHQYDRFPWLEQMIGHRYGSVIRDKSKLQRLFKIIGGHD